MGRVLVAGALAAPLSVGLPAAAQARWGTPFQFTAPGTLDVLAPQLAISSSGAAAAAFGMQDVDTPGTSQGYLTLRSPRGAVGQPAAIGGASQILAEAYDHGGLELLTGTTAADQVCCSSAQAVAVSAAGRPAPPRTLVSGLTGPTLAQLQPLAGGQMLAAVATERGVWVVQSAKANRFGAQHLLTGGGLMPSALATAWLGGQATIVAWTGASGTAGAADPRTIAYALGSRTSAPRRVRTAITVPAGHRVDELGVAARAGSATVAWIESWFDGHGNYHSQVRAADVAPHAAATTLSAASRLASGLSFAGDPAGDQALSWESCTVNDACTTQVAVRGAHGSFGGARALGAIDSSQTPALTVGAKGQAVVAWVRGGRPVAAVARTPGRAFGAAQSLSSSTYADDIALASGAGGRALAAWTQGTLNPSVVGAAYSG
ncbi:MAG TPA: hypothetical protein VHX62_12985 [Solirubrobacteraceae bacterium]|nr:hypothetical protein [Solirubrobacteraceae bacterium]